MSLNNKMTIDCFGNATSTTLLATSDMFHVYDAPKTGLKTVTDTAFTYEGKLGNVQSLIEAFDSSMGSISCTGCPKGNDPHESSAVLKISVSGLLPGSSGDTVDISKFKDSWSPI